MVKGVTKEYIEKLTERITLNIFSVGCDRKNFEILNYIPSKTQDIGKKLDITKMPLNKRLNELEEVGLLKRVKHEGRLERTHLTDKFISIVRMIRDDVLKEIPNIL